MFLILVENSFHVRNIALNLRYQVFKSEFVYLRNSETGVLSCLKYGHPKSLKVGPDKT